MRHLFFLLTTDERCARDSARSCTRVCVRVCVYAQVSRAKRATVCRVSVCGYVVFIRVPPATPCANVRTRVYACDGHDWRARFFYPLLFFSLYPNNSDTISRLIAFANESKRVSHGGTTLRRADRAVRIPVDLDKGARK